MRRPKAKSGNMAVERESSASPASTPPSPSRRRWNATMAATRKKIKMRGWWSCSLGGVGLPDQRGEEDEPKGQDLLGLRDLGKSWRRATQREITQRGHQQEEGD